MSSKIYCSICGKEISYGTEPSEDWKYFCALCGYKEVQRLIKESDEYYKEGNEIKTI